MNFLKKILLTVFVCMTAVCLLTACGGDKTDGNTPSPEETDKPHTHTASGEWQADKDGHWKLCADDGEKTDSAAHELDSKGKCSVCGVGVVTEDGLTELYYYDEKGNWNRRVNYDANGNTTEDTVAYEYFDDGNIKSMKLTKNGKLGYEAEYLVDDGGYNYEAKSTQYNEDGSQLFCEYTSDGEISKEKKTKADGTVEYDYTMVYTYGDNAKKTNEKTYNGDKLIKEVNYIVLFADSWGGGSYKLEVITYNDDGTKTVEYFTENGEPYVE